MSNDSSKPKPERMGTFGPVSALLVTFLTYLGSQIIAVVAITGIYRLVTNQSSDEILRQFIESTNGQFLFIVLAEAAVLAIIYWFINYRKIPLSEIGLGRLPKLSDVGQAVIYAVGYFIVTFIVIGLVSNLIPSVNVNQEQQIGFESASGGLQLGLVFLALAIFVPIAEEVMVRGFLYSGLRRKLNRTAAALIASVLFGIAHL